jgi:putative transposase
MSRPGTPTDNPFAERFVSTFKQAVVRRKPYRTFGELLQAAAKWINFYNNRRPHKGAQNLPPNVYAQKYGWPVVPKITNLTVH